MVMGIKMSDKSKRSIERRVTEGVVDGWMDYR